MNNWFRVENHGLELPQQILILKLARSVFGQKNISYTKMVVSLMVIFIPRDRIRKNNHLIYKQTQAFREEWALRCPGFDDMLLLVKVGLLIEIQ